MNLSKKTFLTTGSYQEPVFQYTLQNDHQMEVDVITYGCIVTDVRVPDKEGNVESVVLGFDDLGEYEQNAGLCLGSVVGRIAGRIGGAAFSLEGTHYSVSQNDGANALHGNHEFANANWEAEPVQTEDHVGVIFSYTSPDGSNGFPGEISCKVTYLLNNDNTFSIFYEAVSTKTTVLNLTNHTYFNLSGNLKTTITGHVLQAEANRFLELKPDCIPSGAILPVENTPFDFRNGKAIREGIASDYPQNVLVHHGYDHPFLFAEGVNSLSLSDQASGRVLTITTDYPCFVMYTGNYFDRSSVIRGRQTEPYLGVALETQLCPDAMNQPQFGNVTLPAGKKYLHKTTWHFGIK